MGGPITSIVILTGAGISAESGLSTFRDPEGVWAKWDPEEVATPRAFERNRGLVLDFYNMRRRQLLDSEVRPNEAHLALAELERRWPGGLTIVTQNIDDLHERAGCRRVIHMHGELLKARCERSGVIVPRRNDIALEDTCSCCGRERSLRPHVVWFGEVPLEMQRIAEALSSCDIFAAIGTSGNVYPASGFAQSARAAGARTVELNLETTAVSDIFDRRILGPAGRTVPAFVSELLGGAPSH
ncbi:MAG TPA: NAD-dependent deacylase [Candidatus Polarisedimenticolia bacterium]|nr:NAD-dependent deacylase [Candidatus Polarisedimenticolia bacterium]